MRFGIIYKATNVVNNKCYIGQTINFSRRKIEHLSESRRTIPAQHNSKFYNAIRKYGWDNFNWEIIYKDIPENRLDIAEMCAIYTFDSCDRGYNSTTGGEGGSARSEETKIKMSQSAIRQYQGGRTPWNKGISRTKEERQKMSDNHWDNSGANHPLYGAARPDISEMNRHRIGDKNPRFGKKAWNSGITFYKRPNRQYLIVDTLTDQCLRVVGIKKIEEFSIQNNISYSSFLRHKKSKNFRLFILEDD